MSRCLLTISSFKWGGYYTAVMEPGLRVIALQTNYYDSMNEWLDPAKPDIGKFRCGVQLTSFSWSVRVV